MPVLDVPVESKITGGLNCSSCRYWEKLTGSLKTDLGLHGNWGRCTHPQVIRLAAPNPPTHPMFKKEPSHYHIQRLGFMGVLVYSMSTWQCPNHRMDTP